MFNRCVLMLLMSTRDNLLGNPLVMYVCSFWLLMDPSCRQNSGRGAHAGYKHITPSFEGAAHNIDLVLEKAEDKFAWQTAQPPQCG